MDRREALLLLAAWPVVSEAASPTDVRLNFGDFETVTIITKWGEAKISVNEIFQAVTRKPLPERLER